jgi:hypothetical protein
VRQIFSDLLRGLDLTEGFVLQPIVVGELAVLAVLRSALEQSGRRVAFVAPYRGGWRDLVDTLETLPKPYGAVLLAGEAPLGPSQRRGLAALNLARDRLVKVLGCPLLLCGTAEFISECAGAMPDFWSIRATTWQLPAADESGVVVPQRAVRDELDPDFQDSERLHLVR